MKAIAAMRSFFQQPCPCKRDVAVIMMQETTGWLKSRFRLNLPVPAPIKRENQATATTGGMINAGHYTVRLLLKNGKGRWYPVSTSCKTIDA